MNGLFCFTTWSIKLRVTNYVGPKRKKARLMSILVVSLDKLLVHVSMHGAWVIVSTRVITFFPVVCMFMNG